MWQDIPQQNMDFDRFKEEVLSAWRANRNSPALVQWQLYNEGWGEGDPAQSNATVAFLSALESPPLASLSSSTPSTPSTPSTLSTAYESRTADVGAPANATGTWETPETVESELGAVGTRAPQQRLIDDASGGRGFSCEAGWVDPTKCAADSRCMAIFWTGGCRGDVVDHHHYPEPRGTITVTRAAVTWCPRRPPVLPRASTWLCSAACCLSDQTERPTLINTPHVAVPFDLADVANASGKPFLLGEYGGYSLPVIGHEWSPCDGSDARRDARRLKMHGAAAALPDPGLTNAFVAYNQDAAKLLSKGLAAQIFTQITDIECERSGLLTYDRLPKANYTAVAAANFALLQAAETREADL